MSLIANLHGLPVRGRPKPTGEPLAGQALHEPARPDRGILEAGRLRGGDRRLAALGTHTPGEVPKGHV
jgi:hypothetical protein